MRATEDNYRIVRPLDRAPFDENMGSRAPGSNIESLVYFDMETTGLPRDIPRITELSMVAVSVRDCINNKDIRIINKLTLCFSPDSVVTAKAAEISGLSNSLLEKMPQFDGETVRVRKDFTFLDFFKLVFLDAVASLELHHETQSVTLFKTLIVTH